MADLPLGEFQDRARRRVGPASVTARVPRGRPQRPWHPSQWERATSRLRDVDWRMARARAPVFVSAMRPISRAMQPTARAPRISRAFMFRSLKDRRDEDRAHISAVPGVDAHNPVLSHVDTQIRWYDENARRSMAWHFRLRGAQIAFAAAIPVTQILPAAVGWRVAAGVLGGLIAICQGFDGMHHYGDHHVAWRATCQQLLRERQLFAAGAGDYAGLEPNSPTALGQLAAHAAALEGQEQQKWAAGQLKGPAGSDAQKA